MCSVESARKAETEKVEDSGFVVVVEVEEGGLVEFPNHHFYFTGMIPVKSPWISSPPWDGIV
ncbi:hypothetical protein SADUNF_Sadunf09G0085300 [Salix dunnii]|uniref:Uncharacterized protein n=1 Tax=Salix dunnii TaxID=1413687 RepID=A0A835JWD0_9ROSI|nr:hypothetical protein SADUNF_Sadunf09G0085300 [Salix dunnii]